MAKKGKNAAQYRAKPPNKLLKYIKRQITVAVAGVLSQSDTVKDDLVPTLYSYCTLFTHTGIASTFTISKIRHILRTYGMMGLKFWLVIGINIHKLRFKVPPRTKIISREKGKV